MTSQVSIFIGVGRWNKDVGSPLRPHIYDIIYLRSPPLNLLFQTSLVVQWLRIPLPTQGTQVWALVWEDLTCRGATKPVYHNYWACALEPASHNYWARAPRLLKPARLEPVLRNKRSHCSEKPAHLNEELPPLAATRGSPHAETKTQRSQK